MHKGVKCLGREKGIDPDKVAIYIRWSTDDQSDGTTLEVQQEGCKHYLLSQGWVVNEDLIFVDDGWSGGNLERPAMTRMRTLVRAGKVDCVVVFKLDRLSRSVIDMVNLVLEEWDGQT
jgi:site-specific DNA recombinase